MDNFDRMGTTIKGCTLQNPPDGGWGWVVTFSAFIVGAIVDGISYSFGILFVELLDYYGESRSLTSLIISVMSGTYGFIGKMTSFYKYKKNYFVTDTLVSYNIKLQLQKNHSFPTVLSMSTDTDFLLQV